MVKNTIILALITLLMAGCDKEAVIREFPVIRTLDASNVNSEGATFRGELIREGTNKTTSYGFIWGIKENPSGKYEKIVLGNEISEGRFETRIDYSLSEGFEYYIRAFATYDNKTVYGNTITLVSKGCGKSAWCRELSGINFSGWETPYGWSDGANGFVLFQNGIAYKYDPDKKSFSRIAAFPLSGNTGTKYTAVGSGGSQYVFNSIDRKLYKYANENWTAESNTPFFYGNFNGYYHGYSTMGKIFLLSSTQSFSYKPDTKTWETMLRMPATNFSVGGTDLNGFAYVVDVGKNIRKYNPQDNSWQQITTYPGRYPGMTVYFNIFYGNMIGFSSNSSIFFGFSYEDDSSGDWIDKSFWEYNLSTNSWKKIEDFPQEINPGRIFYFFLKGKLYIGHEDSGVYSLYSLDTSKL